MEGRPFGTISRELGYRNAPEATVAFLRVLRAQPDPVRSQVCREEHVRLEALREHVARDGSLTAEVRTRRLAVVARLRRDVDRAVAP